MPDMLAFLRAPPLLDGTAGLAAAGVRDGNACALNLPDAGHGGPCGSAEAMAASER